MSKLFILLTILFGQQAFADVVISNTNSAQKKLIEYSLSYLPTKVANSIKSSAIKFQVKSLNKNALNTPCDQLPYIYGEYQNGVVSLDNALIERALVSELDSEDYSCKHKSYKKLFVSTVIHEAFHAYDLSKNKKDRVENNELFKSLGFFDLDRKKKNFNSFPMRSPNKYEYTNTREFVAVNFEYFILDSKFKCRRPNLYKAFESLLGVAPYPEQACLEQNRMISLSDTQINKIVNMDMERVREIHYLFASKGQAIMSRFGHSMFKFVLCDKQLSLKDCRIRGENVVIGFLAQNGDENLNMLKGIFGKYNADIVVSDIDSMKRQYNRAEFRDLESYPLKLNENQKERFVNHFLNLYWEYSGKYYFFTNNCADEAFRLLQVAYDESYVYDKEVATPIGIKKFLKKKGLIDESILADRKSAVSQGLLYESFFDKLDEGFQFVYKQYPRYFKAKKLVRNHSGDRHDEEREVTYRVKDIEKYSNLDVFKRREIIQKVLEAKPTRKTVLGLYVAETHAHFVTSNKILNFVQENVSIDKLSGDSLNIFKRIVELKNMIVFGQNIEGTGYGIPQGNEVESVITDEMVKAQEELNDLTSILREIFTELFDYEYKLIEESEFNKNMIKNYLRS